MRKISYHVAATLDHYIAQEDGSANGFPAEGDHVTEYLAGLQDYDTVIMGRHTYEFGYQYGIEPGQPAYPHMQHYLFSKSLQFDKPSDQVAVIKDDQLGFVRTLKKGEGSPIYLCGGGEFAGWLLDHELIDELKIKLNPVIFGSGIPLFGDSQKAVKLQLTASKTYESGVLLLTYDVLYS
jgi:dihydrofolate reductase